MDLFPVSKLIANAAMNFGGSDIGWYKGILCPYVRDDGSPCFDETRGSSWVECPICGGEGTTYAFPKFIKGIYTDKSNEFIPDGSGGFIRGEKTLSVSTALPITLMKPRHTEVARRFIRDKFTLLGKCCNPDGSREIIEVMYLADDTIKPTVNSGAIYQIIKVQNNA
jgi:hypothetical protein